VSSTSLHEPASVMHGFASDVLTGLIDSGYNPPQFILDAAKSALDRVDCNQYSPTKGRPRLKKAIADAYSPYFGRTLDPETEVTVTTGANEGACEPAQCCRLKERGMGEADNKQAC